LGSDDVTCLTLWTSSILQCSTVSEINTTARDTLTDDGDYAAADI